MKVTGRFALVLGALACAFLLLLLFASPAAAQHTGTGMVLPGGSGGMSTVTADARYLKLDATNDPLTGALTLPQSTAAAPSLNFAGATTTGIYQTGTGIGFTRGGTSLFDVGSSVSYAQLTTSYFLLNSGLLELDVFSGLYFFSGAVAPSIGSAHTVNTASTYRANGGISIHSAVSSGGGYAVAIGSSAAMSNTGILASFADTITAAGAPRRKLNIFADGHVEAGLGTGSTPTYSFMGDADTGMYSGGANIIQFSLGSPTADYFYMSPQQAYLLSTANGLTQLGAASSSAGSAAYAELQATASGSTAGLVATSSAYTAAGAYPQAGTLLYGGGAGGFNIWNSTASGPIRFMSGTSPVTTIASVASTGILPGTDNTYNLGSSTLSWAQVFTKYVTDQAGVDRLTLFEAGTTTLAATTPITGGVDSGLLLNVSTDFAVTDKALILSDNTAVSSTALMNVYGNGQIEAAGLGWISSGTTRMTFGAGPAINFDINGTQVTNIAAGGLTVASGSLTVTTGGIALSTVGSAVASNNFTNGPSGTTSRTTLKTSATDDPNGVYIYSAMNASGEDAVWLGTSDNTATGQNLTTWCVDCDGVTPTSVAELNSAGNFQMDGDLTVSGGDITVSTVASISNVGDAQFDGTLQVDTGLKIGTAGTTITESNSVSTGSVDFASISADTCGEKTLTLTGADVNTPVACSFPAALEANLIGMCFVSAADTVTIRLCNMTAVAIDPAAATFGARTIK